jgi:hypothetical protein
MSENGDDGAASGAVDDPPGSKRKSRGDGRRSRDKKTKKDDADDTSP